jgi:hypothetical protein
MLTMSQAGCRACTGLLLTLITTPAIGHHGRDFLLTQSAHIAARGEVYAIARQDYVDEGADEEAEFEPTLIGSVTDWLSLEAHSHIEKVKGESAEYESTAAVAQVRFTPRESALAIGGSVEYEFAHDSDSEDAWGFTGIATYEGSAWIVGVNLLAERETGGGAETEWGYAVGIRRSFTEKFAVGLEVRGTLEDENEGEVLAGTYFDLSRSFTVNVGMGTGFNDGLDLSVRTALVFHLR